MSQHRSSASSTLRLLRCCAGRARARAGRGPPRSSARRRPWRRRRARARSGRPATRTAPWRPATRAAGRRADGRASRRRSPCARAATSVGGPMAVISPSRRVSSSEWAVVLLRSWPGSTTIRDGATPRRTASASAAAAGTRRPRRRRRRTAGGGARVCGPARLWAMTTVAPAAATTSAMAGSRRPGGVVDDVGTRRQAAPGHLRPGGVDGEDDVAARAHAPDHREHPVQLGRLAHPGGVGGEGHPADVDPVRALLHGGQGAVHGRGPGRRWRPGRGRSPGCG